MYMSHMLWKYENDRFDFLFQTMSTSTDNHFEANEKPRDDMAQFNSSGLSISK